MYMYVCMYFMIHIHIYIYIRYIYVRASGGIVSFWALKEEPLDDQGSEWGLDENGKLSRANTPLFKQFGVSQYQTDTMVEFSLGDGGVLESYAYNSFNSDYLDKEENMHQFPPPENGYFW